MAQAERDKNLEFFQRKLPELLGNPVYELKFVVINEQQVKASYDSFSTALEYAVANFPQDEFIIQQVIRQADRINFLRAAI